MPGVAVIIIAGIVAAIAGNFPILGTGWIFWSIVLLTISGLAFMFRVAPLQRRMLSIAVAGVNGQMDWAAYEAATRSVERLGNDGPAGAACGGGADGAQARAADPVSACGPETNLMDDPDDVLRFWFPSIAPDDPTAMPRQLEWWFRGGADAVINERFQPLHERAGRGILDGITGRLRSHARGLH